jgi:hypothetical protein
MDMKTKRFTEEQIIGILRQAQAGMKVVDLSINWRRGNIIFFPSESTYSKQYSMDILIGLLMESWFICNN